MRKSVSRTSGVTGPDGPIWTSPLARVGELLLASSSVGLIGIDKAGCVRLSGRGADMLFGDSDSGTLTGRSIDSLLPGFSVDRLNRKTEMIEIGQWTPEWLIDGRRGEAVRCNGGHFAVQFSVARVVSGTDVCYVILLIDLTAQLEHGDALRRLAYRDIVTDLPNRAHFMGRLRQAVAGAEERGSALALLFIDIDRFKEINDTIGHAGGDRALQIVGQRLASAVRPQDIVARHGGDEFVVLMEESSSPAVATRAAERVAKRILEALQAPVRLSDRAFGLSVSIGIALQTGKGENPDTLLAAADSAMYQAKSGGGGAFTHAADIAPPPRRHRRDHR